MFFYNFNQAYHNRKYYGFTGGIIEYWKEYTSYKSRIEKKKVNRLTVTDFYNRRFYIPNFDIRLRNFNYQTNSFGMLSKNVSAIKGRDTYRILCLGSSTSVNYPPLLEKRLNEIPRNKKIEVITGAVTGATLLNSFMNFSLNWRDLKPDMIIIDHNIDDVEVNILPFYLSNYKKSSYHFIEQLKYQIPVQSGILILLDMINSKILGGKISEPAQEGLDAFRKKLEALVLVAKGMNIKIVLLSAGIGISDLDNLQSDKKTDFFYKLYFSHFSPKGVLKVINGYNKIIKEVADNYNVTFIDMSKVVPPKERYYRDLTHRSDAGDTVFVDFLSGQISNLSD